MRTSSLVGLGLSAPPLGRSSLRLCSSSGVVMTKMINKTKARSSNGVMLISLRVTNAFRCENRRISKTLVVVLQILDFHFGDQLLRKIIKFDCEHAQGMDQ